MRIGDAASFIGAFLFLALASLPLGGCGVVDPIENRAEIMNKSTAEYTNVATLLNIVRASKYEQPNFMAVTGIVGHNTFTGSLGIPTVTFGPDVPVINPSTAPTRNYSFGPNTLQGSVSNDFNVSNPDDPNTYAALLTPVNPALLAMLINQGYPREWIFFLVVDHMVISTQTESRYLSNNPDGLNFDDFAGYLASLLANGLTAQVDVEAVWSPKTVPANRLCFDPELPPPSFPEVPRSAVSPKCSSKVGWSLARLADDPKKKDHKSGYKLEYKGANIQLGLRSAFGIYAYLGALLRNHTKLALLEETPDPFILTIVTNETDCFTQVSYEGLQYCVPYSAIRTKQIFVVMHQITGLLTQPNATPNTQTVRAVPGGS
jgi:hypothetical protein